MRQRFDVRKWLQPTWKKVVGTWKWLILHVGRWSEYWPLNSVLAFFKALPLLSLWLLAAYGVYALLPDQIKKEIDALTALIGPLVAGLVGFGIQQWKMLSSTEEERKKERQAAKAEIDQWRVLLQDNPSEGARRYEELSSRRGGVWRMPRIRGELNEAWRTTAPAALRDAVRLLAYVDETERFKKIAGKMEESRPAHVLEWTQEHLDDDWRQRAWQGFLLLSKLPGCVKHIDDRRLQQGQQRQWVQILRCSPQISLWHRLPPTPDTVLADGLRYVGLQVPPFGNAVAETDSALLKTRISPSWWKDVRLFETASYTGDKGAGKTATALWMACDALTADWPLFPVYWRGTPEQLRFEALVRSLAHTLLHYLAVTPEDFLKSSIGRKASMAHLLARYFAPRLTYHSRRAGVPGVGEGAQMVQEIETLAQSAPVKGALSENNVLALLHQARPRPFEATLMLLDVQAASVDTYEWGKKLSVWCDRLVHAGVFIKVFLPETLEAGVSLNVPRYELAFSQTDLKTILDQRLRHSGESGLLDWCHPVMRSLLPDLDAWIVHASRGNPGKMFRLGNELLRRIGQKQALLAMDDLIDILADPPKEATG